MNMNIGKLAGWPAGCTTAASLVVVEADRMQTTDRWTL